MKRYQNSQATFTASGVHVFATMLQVEHFGLVVTRRDRFDDVTTGMLVAVFKHAAMFHMLLVILWISDAMQRTADHGLRFCRLGDHDGFESMFTSGYVAVFADEVGKSGACINS